MGLLDWLRGRQSPGGIYSGGTGDAASTAVVINANSSLVGISEEYAYVQQQCGQQDVDWALKLQMQTSRHGKDYDVLSMALRSGGTRTFWFDITAFYGKF